MNYPIWWDSAVTVYNKHEDGETRLVTWHRSVIDGCFIKNANNKVTVGQSVLETNNIIVRIPQQDNFYEPAKWQELPEEERQIYFTLQPGDIIVRGEVTDEIDEYTKGARSTDLIAKYKSCGVCLVISKWQDNTGAGKIYPHYFVSGE